MRPRSLTIRRQTDQYIPENRFWILISMMNESYAEFEDRLTHELAKGFPINYHSSPGGDTLLHKAVSYGCSSAIIDILISHGADPDATNSYNRNALMQSCIEYKPDIFLKLLNVSKDLNKTDRDGYTAWGRIALDYLFSDEEEQKRYEPAIRAMIEKNVDMYIDAAWYYMPLRDNYAKASRQKLCNFISAQLEQRDELLNRSESETYEYSL